MKYSRWKERFCDGPLWKGEPLGLIRLRKTLEKITNIRGEHYIDRKN